MAYVMMCGVYMAALLASYPWPGTHVAIPGYSTSSAADPHVATPGSLMCWVGMADWALIFPGISIKCSVVYKHFLHAIAYRN